MQRLVSCGNHYGVVNSLEDVFNSFLILSSKEAADFKFKVGDVLLIGGGEDISPYFYNQKLSRYTGAGALPSNRDVFESLMINKALEAGIPSIGICRGAQLLCAMSGGSLYQHVNGHGVSHNITTKDGTILRVSSAHHQMMNPFGTEHELIAWTSEKLSNCYLIENEKNLKVEVEPEIIYFNRTKALAVQWHPEFMNSQDDAVLYLKTLMYKYLGN